MRLPFSAALNRVALIIMLFVLVVGLSGCATIKSNPYACDVIRDATYAVGSFGCSKVQDKAAADACGAAALAASLIARESCLKQQALASGKALAVIETGDPPMGIKAELFADARALMDEYHSLEPDPELVKGAR